MNGVASGLRSIAWKTTPAAASAAPTHAAASTRGIRATKKICASTLSANGIERSNTRAMLIGVLPTSGASRHAAAASVPKPASVSASRALIGRRAASAYSMAVMGARRVRKEPTCGQE